MTPLFSVTHLHFSRYIQNLSSRINLIWEGSTQRPDFLKLERRSDLHGCSTANPQSMRQRICHCPETGPFSVAPDTAVYGGLTLSGHGPLPLTRLCGERKLSGRVEGIEGAHFSSQPPEACGSGRMSGFPGIGSCLLLMSLKFLN